MSDQSTLTVAEIAGIANATLRERKANQGVKALGRLKFPSLKDFLGAAADESAPERGDFIVDVKGNRDQEFQSWSGRDTLTYDDAETVFQMTFGSGRVHYGLRFVHQDLEESGISVDYSAAAMGKKRPWKEMPSRAKNIVYNRLMEKLEDADYDYDLKLALHLWRSNAADAKLWAGIDGLYPVTGNSTGTIGGKNRSDPLLRHVLKTSVADDDWEHTVDDGVYEANKYNRRGRIRRMYCGRHTITSLTKLLRTGATGITPIVTRNADASSQVDRTNLGVDPEGFYLQSARTFLVPEPLFEELDTRDAPATAWTKRWYGIDTKNTRLRTVKHKQEVVKPTPYNQQITYISMYGQYALTDDQPNAVLVGYNS